VGNSGHSPSIADSYALQVLLTNKTSVNGNSIDIPDQYTFTALTSNLNIPFVLTRSDLIEEKTSKAIQPGDEPRGWIAFTLPGVSLIHLARTNFTIVLSFSDINAKRTFVTNGFYKGKPARTEETLEHPRTLPGSGNLIAKTDANVHQSLQTNNTGWLPPELPPNCSNVTVFFGGQSITYPLIVAEISTEASGTKFLIKDLPDYLLTGLDKMSNYSPLNRNLWIRWGVMQQDYGGKLVSSPILPFVISNRFFVEVKIPFVNDWRKIVMSDEFDSELSKLPRTWDRNYSTNAGSYVYEVVDELTNPVLQVFYTKPNEVHVNGIFVLDTNSVLESFGEPPLLKTVSYRLISLTNGQEITNISGVFGTNSFAGVITNILYNMPQPGQRAIFKYPSNRHPGAFAN
jgi:hypothetical protein